MKKMMFSAFAAAVLAAPALAGAQSPSPSPAPSPQTPPSTPPAATAPAQAGEARAAKADKAMGELVKVDAVNLVSGDADFQGDIGEQLHLWDVNGSRAMRA